MPDYDLIIRNGSIVDGTGAPARRRRRRHQRRPDRGRRRGHGRRAGARSTRAGMAVAPGFVDVHAHDDAAVVRDPRVDFKIMQGVTTDVVGNCGAGVAPANDAFRPFYARGFGAILGDERAAVAHDGGVLRRRRCGAPGVQRRGLRAAGRRPHQRRWAASAGAPTDERAGRDAARWSTRRCRPARSACRRA